MNAMETNGWKWRLLNEKLSFHELKWWIRRIRRWRGRNIIIIKHK